MSKLNFVSKELITKGWSSDKKYCVTDESGARYLLRLSDISQYNAKEIEFQMMKKVAALGVPMCRPIAFGCCDENLIDEECVGDEEHVHAEKYVYSLQEWIEGGEGGGDAEELMPGFSDTEQYVYGLEAGRILKKIHSIPAPSELEDWSIRFNRKLDNKIKKYGECPLKYQGGEAFVDYINANRHLLKGRPQVYQHGDYHIGNMMIDQDGKLQIIDFNRSDFGDPWEEFNRIVWCAQASPLFASGMVNGYFDGQVPMEFWKLLALYIAGNTLSSIYWAIPFGEAEVNTMINQAAEVLEWYDHMRNPVPKWYFEGYYLQEIDGVPFKLKSPFDFSFLNKYGKVFQVFDDQDSGNICFGTEKDGERYFVKFAGAPTERSSITPEVAVARIKETLAIYQDLQHPNLLELVAAEDIGGGYALVFKWTDGVCMGRMYPAAHQRFMQLPIAERLKVFEDILSFFEHMAAQNYVAIDFYDGSIMYDFALRKTKICDIDYFREMPTVNDMGHMWGSSRFQAPEEYQLGADLDEITNVYTLGATAFALFGEYYRTREKWQLSEELFAVAKKAVSDNRSERQQSIREFSMEWKEVLLCRFI